MNIETYITNNRSEVKGILYYKVKDMSFGRALIGVLNEKLCWLGFDLDPQSIQSRFPAVTLQEEDEEIEFSTITLYGTAFQVLVWQSLLKVQKGSVITYQDIANDIEKPKAVRAVGSAVGSNPVSVFVPCHRVLPKSGGVGSYLWGAEKKAELLQAENVIL